MEPTMIDLETLEKAEFIYKFLWDSADKIFRETNPCKISKSGSCQNSKKGTCCPKGYCRFLTPKGCSTECLTCKLYLCVNMSKSYRKLESDLDKMRSIANACGFRTLFYQSWQEELYTSMKIGLDLGNIEKCADILKSSHSIDAAYKELGNKPIRWPSYSRYQ